MNIDDLKATWKQYDSQLQTTHLLNQKIITSMMTERSQSRLAMVKSRYLFSAALMLVWLTVAIAILAGNPFDYSSAVEYAPVLVLAVCLTVMLALTAKAFIELKNTDLSQTNLLGALRHIIKINDKPQKYMRWTVIIMFSASLLFPLSFLPRKIAHNGLGQAIADTLIPMAVALVLYFIAHKLGMFNDVNGARFKQYLHELEELKALSNDLSY